MSDMIRTSFNKYKTASGGEKNEKMYEMFNTHCREEGLKKGALIARLVKEYLVKAGYDL